MTLEFGASATIGSLRYDSHLTRVRVTRGIAPRAGSAVLELPPSVRVDAALEDDVSLLLHGERSDVEVFGGVVHRVERGLDRTTVTAGDALARLAASRPGVTYEQQSAGDVIRAFATEVGISLGSIDSGTDLATYVADQGHTALEHTARMAAWGGAFATSEADGSLSVRTLPTGPAERALRYGREIAELRIRDRVSEPELVWAGSGPSGNVSAPDAHLHSVSALPEGAPSPGPRTVRRAAPALRTPAAATDAIAAAAARNVARKMFATCWLQPDIGPGAMIEVADAPTPESLGPWFITSVVHELGPGPRGVTRLEGEQLAEGGGILGQLLGALGGFL